MTNFHPLDFIMFVIESIKKTDPDTFLYASREKVVVYSEPVLQK